MNSRSVLGPLTALFLLLPLACDDKQDGVDEELANEGDDEGDADAEGDGDGDEAEEPEPDVPSNPSPPGPEQCDVVGEARECDDAGTQFCDWHTIDSSSELVWSECSQEFACMPGEQQECGFAGTQHCEIEEGVPYWGDCPFTPLVLSFDGGPIEMAASSATFDIANVGECLDSDWPAAANPWLAIDLDKNGSIDAGHELFGSGVILPSGQHAQNGFVALELLDSNHDRQLDARDQQFEELLLWRDEDADKLSTGWELTSLADAGIERIELDFAVREQCDARGNCGRERSRFEFVAAGQRRIGEVVDVYLACD